MALASRRRDRGGRVDPPRPVRRAGADRRRMACRASGAAAAARCADVPRFRVRRLQHSARHPRRGTKRAGWASPKSRCAGRCCVCGHRGARRVSALRRAAGLPRDGRARSPCSSRSRRCSSSTAGSRVRTRSRCCSAGSPMRRSTDITGTNGRTAAPARHMPIDGDARRRGCMPIARAFRAGAARVGARFDLRARPPARRRRAALRWLLLLAAATGVLIAACGASAAARASAVARRRKARTDIPGIATLTGVWYAWLGTSSTIAVRVCLALAACGAPDVWQRAARSAHGALGVALTLVAVVLLSRPMS